MRFPQRLETNATTFELVSDGEREWSVRIGMIERARHRLYVSTYYLEHDDHADEFLRKLIEASKRGVDVRLAYDAFAQRLGARSASKAQRESQRRLVEALIANGAVVTVWQGSRRRHRLLGAGNHIKVQLSEEGEVLFGSSNISRRSIREWNELSALMTGPINELLEQWFLAATSDVFAVPSSVERDPPGHAFEFVWYDPSSAQSALWPLRMTSNPITDLLIDAIQEAREKIWITSFYFKPTPRLRRAVVAAARRGVDVVVVHSGRGALFESNAPWLGAVSAYKELLDAGVEVFERNPGEHSKVVVVDGRWATFGTYNLEHAAHDRLAEAMLVTRDLDIVTALQKTVTEAMASPGSARMTTAAIRGLPLHLRARVIASRLLQRWL